MSSKKIVSIDVGIRNLSFCFLETNILTKEYKILKWDNIDLTEKETVACCDTGCKKAVKFCKDTKYYCVKHSKNANLLKPQKDLKSSVLNKKKVGELVALIEKYKIVSHSDKSPIDKSLKKKDFVSLLEEFGMKNCLENITTINATKINLVTIGRNIQHKLDQIFQGYIETLDTIIIENQIGPLANKMKTVQGMLAQYFIMKNENIEIEFISASNKLKDLNVDNVVLDYKGRKKMGVQCCLALIDESWKSFFEKHKKKDDLADCFLQGLWYINHK